jgi:hypothetical protein
MEKIEKFANNIFCGLIIPFNESKYKILFLLSTLLFIVFYSLLWNIIRYPTFYINYYLLNFRNFSILFTISILSGLTITLGIFNFKKMHQIHKSGFLAMLSTLAPAFISSCSCSAPLLFSFTSQMIAIGLAITRFTFIIEILSIIILVLTVLYVSYNICSICKCGRKNRMNYNLFYNSLEEKM